MTRHSGSFSGPGLCRICSGTPILPMSCSRKPYSSEGFAAYAGIEHACELERVALHAVGVLAACRCPSSRGRPRARRPCRGRRARAARAARARSRRGGGGRARRGAAAPPPSGRSTCATAFRRVPPASRSTTPSSSSGRNGFSRSASAPAAPATSSTSSRPVSSTTGISAVAGSDLSARQKASPSMPGMPTSSTITSGRLAPIRSSASAALSASSTVDLDVLERRAQELAKPGIVVDQQQAHMSPVIGRIGPVG